MEKTSSAKITKPFQLLATWFVGLISIDSTFLIAAANLTGWRSELLVIASVANVPPFLVLVFLLQTKFRVELQEDNYYSRHQSRKTNNVSSSRASNIELKPNISTLPVVASEGPGSEAPDLKRFSIGINDYLKNFQEIRNAFKEKGIPVSSIFGKSNGATSPPDGKIVAINYAMSFSAKLQLFQILANFGLDGYAYFDPSDEAEGSEDVLIGSYNSKQKTCPFNSSFKKMLENKPESVDLQYFERDFIRHPYYTEDEILQRYYSRL